QMIQPKDQPSLLLDFFAPGNQAVARTAHQQWNARMDSQQLQHLRCLREKLWGHEDQSQARFGHLELAAQVFGPFLQAALVEPAGPMRRYRIRTVHAPNVLKTR